MNTIKTNCAMTYHLANSSPTSLKTAITALLFCLSAMATPAQFPAPANPPQLVSDFTGTLPHSSASDLENRLTAFANQTSTQIAVVLINDLSGYTIADYTFRLAEQWGIGQKGKNNGILLLIKPKTGNTKGEAFIATGYGLEGAVPDAVAHRIVNIEMIPFFKKNDYYGGIIAGTKVLMELTQGEYTADTYLKNNKTTKVAVIAALFLFVIVAGLLMKSRKTASLGHNIPFLVLMSMLGSEMQKHSDSWNDFSSGSGGSSSGGFGGFGGGSFGGGGAGGSW